MTDAAPVATLAALATDVPVRTVPSRYPAPFAERMAGRTKRALGDAFGLRHFGVNLTVLQPGAVSALRHAHRTQDEFVYVLSGRLRLVSDQGTADLVPGMCAGFAAGTGVAHHLLNLSDEDATYLEVGDRSPGDEAHYPDDDLVARAIEGGWVFLHKDGRPY